MGFRFGGSVQSVDDFFLPFTKDARKYYSYIPHTINTIGPLNTIAARANT
jgi:sRNA-binding regulator protein Hfq